MLLLFIICCVSKSNEYLLQKAFGVKKTTDLCTDTETETDELTTHLKCYTNGECSAKRYCCFNRIHVKGSHLISKENNYYRLQQ